MSRTTRRTLLALSCAYALDPVVAYRGLQIYIPVRYVGAKKLRYFGLYDCCATRVKYDADRFAQTGAAPIILRTVLNGASIARQNARHLPQFHASLSSKFGYLCCLNLIQYSLLFLSRIPDFMK